MPITLRAILTSLLITSMLPGCGQAGAQLPAADTARLAAYDQAPDAAGALVYRGETYAQKGAAAQPLYRYERRVAPTSAGMSATHATRDAKGQLIIIESAEYSPSYELTRFDAVNAQMGVSGSVVVSNNGRRLEYHLNDNGKISTATEDLADPAVSGPSMFGFILRHWDALLAGQTVPVRMVVLNEKTTYGFNVSLEKQTNAQTAFTIVPSSFIIRLAVAPLRVVFDNANKTAVRYEGRVPPKEVVDGKLNDLDARVEYQSVAARYR